MGDDKRFRLLIGGGTAPRVAVNKVSIEVVSNAVSPLPVDVRVFEEDTCLVLTVDPVMRHVDEHPVRLMTSILEANQYKPGSVVTKGSSWYAVVLDLEAEPMYRKEWIESAYRESLRLAEERKVKRLGLPLLGTVHGRYPVQDSMLLLINQLRSRNLSNINKIVIPVPNGSGEEIRKLLAHMVGF